MGVGRGWAGGGGGFVGNRRSWFGVRGSFRATNNELRTTTFELAGEDGVVETAEEFLAEIFRESGEGRHGLDRGVQTLGLDAAESGFLQIERHQSRRDWARVGGVEVKVRREDGQTFGVRSFDR